MTTFYPIDSDFVAWKALRVTPHDIQEHQKEREKEIVAAFYSPSVLYPFPLDIILVIIAEVQILEISESIVRWFQLSQSSMYRNMIHNLWGEMFRQGLTLNSLACCREILQDIRLTKCMDYETKHLYSDMLFKRICYGSMNHSVVSFGNQVIKRLYAYRTKHKAYWKRNYTDPPHHLAESHDYRIRFLGILQTDFKEIRVILKLVRDVVNMKKQHQIIIQSFPIGPTWYPGSVATEWSEVVHNQMTKVRVNQRNDLRDDRFECSELAAFEEFLKARKFVKHTDQK